jgi:predicted ATPase
MSVFMLDVSAIAQPVPISGGQNLQPNGKGLAAVLDDLRDNHPERWTALLSEMSEWLPEYDFIHFDTRDGQKAVALRTRKGGHRIAAAQLSQGTLIALALLTLAYLPNPPSLIGLEEIDRGLHPRLLGHLQSALYRLSYPESCGEKQRPPIQVIATTHSPYLLDLYREHPEEVVLAEKEGLEVQFRQLSKIEHFDEILGDGPLSEIWYSGVLGGVSVKP